MSTIHFPDPHPGRCPNYRHGIDGNGEPVTLRCLDYADVPHVCTFPDPPKRLPSAWTTTNVTQAPDPWVKPDPA